MANQNLGQVIKQQILVHLQALQAAASIGSIFEIDQSVNPLDTDPPNGYPLAIVAMPRIAADFEDNVNDMLTYRFDVLFVMNPEELSDTATGVEVLMDQVLAEFNQISALTLENAAVAAVLPVTIEGTPVSTGSKTFLTFVATIQARTLYQTT